MTPPLIQMSVEKVVHDLDELLLVLSTKIYKLIILLLQKLTSKCILFLRAVHVCFSTLQYANVVGTASGKSSAFSVNFIECANYGDL